MIRRTSRPRGRSLVAVATVGLAAALAMAGCAPTSTPSSHSTTKATSKPTTSSGPSPSPSPSASFAPQSYTCDSILPAATLAIFQSKEKDGFTLQTDFSVRMHNIDSDLAFFDDYGGIICQWAYPGATRTVSYGFSPITDEQATAIRASLSKDGYQETQDNRGTLIKNPDVTDFPDNYLFISGYWFYASDPALLDQIYANALQNQASN